MIRAKIIVPVIIVILLCAVWTMAFNIGLSHAKPGIRTYAINSSYSEIRPVYIEVEKPVPVKNPVQTIEVEKFIYIEQQIEVPFEVPVMLKDWDSLEQLEEFLENDDTDQNVTLITDDRGNIAFNGQCEDYALQLRDRAMALGRYLSVEVLHPKEYEKWYDQPAEPDQYHAICMARLGNELWYMEPQTDKLWLALYLD